MWASPFDNCLLNLRQELPPSSLYYLSRAETHAKLKELSGQDFGMDAQRWLQWAQENHRTLMFKAD